MNDNGVRLLLIGPPGAGKGTQAAHIAAAYGIPAISTGDIFRSNVKNETELGVKAKQYMDAGNNVPDSLTNALIRDRLAEPDAARGFLLDGYPRTADQVRELDEFLASEGTALDVVVEILADADVVVDRISKRAAIEGRSDDSADVVRRRLEVYAEQTEPLLHMYDERGVLVRVDGMGTVDQVTASILAAMADRGLAAPAA